MEGRRIALIIAVSEYGNHELQPLNFCRNDGIELSQFLTSKGYEISDNRKLIGKVPFDTMRRAINNFFTDNNIKTDDILVFYYSGHGIPHAYGRYYLASSDIDPNAPINEGFSFDDLEYLINSCNSSKTVTILDCCYSGAAKLAKGQENVAATLGTNIMNDKKKELQGEGKYLLAASQAYQEAYALIEKGHSIFTYYLLEGLKGNKDVLDNDGNVTPSSLCKYVYSMIVNLPEGKKPNQKPVLKAEESGDFPLVSYPDLVQKYNNVKQRTELEWEQSNFAAEDEQLSSVTLHDNIWEDLLNAIRNKKCTPFIGERVCFPSFLSERKIANQWITKYSVPFQYSYDLTKVSQFLASERGDMFPKKEMTYLINNGPLPGFSDPNEPYTVLADLDFPLYISTNYDDFMVRCLESRGKKPIQDFLRWHDDLPEVDRKKFHTEDIGFEPTSGAPLVYNLCGSFKIPQSIVLTESDYRYFNEFIFRLNYNSTDLLPTAIRLTMTNKTLIFIGYTVDDWKFDAVLNWINSFMFSGRNFYLKILVHPMANKEEEEKQQYVQRYLEKKKIGDVNIYWGSVHAFVRELSDRWKSFNK